MSEIDYRAIKKGIIDSANFKLEDMNKLQVKTERMIDVMERTPEIFDELDRQFEEKTGLTGTDVVFLFLATGLQMARQYLLSNEKYRLTSSQNDDLMKKGLNAVKTPPDWKKVLLSSVPYDALGYNEGLSSPGLSGTNHRYRTLGHDPILGWIFGTANIMTSSLTKTDYSTYEVANKIMTQLYPLGTAGMIQNAVGFAANDPKLLVVSFLRQAVHFGSDYFTKQGLPVPMLSTINNDFVGDMITKWHIDMYSITRGATIASFINTIIALIHSLFAMDVSETERKLYEVRTRKILTYSNLIATSTNVAIVAQTYQWEKLDVGGIAVAIHRLITDVKFIREVKEEFIIGTYKQMFTGEIGEEIF